MKHFYSYGSGPFQDAHAPVRVAGELTEWFDEYKKNVSPVQWLLHWPDHNSVEHL